MSAASTAGQQARRVPAGMLALPAATLLLLVSGALLRVFPGGEEWSWQLWRAGLVVTGAPIVWRTGRQALRGRLAADLVALLAIVGAVLLGQPFAGLVVVLMLSGGELLERYAAGRASSALRALEDASPRIAHRLQGARVVDLAVSAIAPGDRLLVRPGELVPCDGVVEDGHSRLDTASLTGEPIPRPVSPGAVVMSGSINGEHPLTVRATAWASESQYARIVDLVRRAQASKAPLQRLADRYAVWFTPFTLLVCLVAYLIAHDWLRVLAVLVVATPCPLILATPVAIVGGINRAARRGVILRSGGALEALAGVDTVVLDKTGTLTLGRPEVSAVRPLDGIPPEQLLQLAASLEQHSGHQLARSVVTAADEKQLALLPARDVREWPGQGIEGMVGGRRVAIGAEQWIGAHAARSASLAPSASVDADALRATVAIDDRIAGVVQFDDRVRGDAREFLDALHAIGVERAVLLSGDHAPRVAATAAELGIGDFRGELLPADKANAVARLSDEGRRVLMVGDGTNDAPALASATVGVALAAHGRAVSAETADAVVLEDSLSRIPAVIGIARRTMRIARQSIGVGLGLSAIAMGAAALGRVPPAVGALLQEGIDVAVILNALRASR